MKAIDYVNRLEEIRQNPPEIYQGVPEGYVPDEMDFLVYLCMDLLQEVKDIAEKRNGKSDGALLSIFREQDQKWVAIMRRLGGIYLPVYRYLFHFYIREKMPDVADRLNWKGRIQGG